MTLVVLFAGLHYLAIMAMVAALAGEHLLFRPGMGPAQARTVARLDIVYGAAATLVLGSGIVRLYLEKGVAYYLHNGAFHGLLSLFVIVALLSVYPTLVFLRWRRPLAAGTLPDISAGAFRTLTLIMRAEMLLVAIMPFLAAWMARGG